jgi:hypothetical protein
MNVSDKTIWMQYVVVRLPLCLLSDSSQGYFPKAGLVVRMEPLKEVFEAGRAILWIESQNTVAFLRPVPNILVRTPGPTACLAEFLRLRQIGPPVAHRFFRQPLVHYVSHGSREFDVTRVITRRVGGPWTCFMEPSSNCNRCSISKPARHASLGRFAAAPVRDRRDERAREQFPKSVLSLDRIRRFGRSRRTRTARRWKRSAKAACVAQSLGLDQISFASPDRFFRNHTFGDIHYRTDKLDAAGFIPLPCCDNV